MTIIIADESVSSYLVKLASNTPTPGGGAATAITAAQGAALLGMVARISGAEAAVIASVDKGCLRLQELATIDGKVFDSVMKAMHLPKGTPEERIVRQDKLEIALKHATEVPLEAMDIMATLLDTTSEVIRLSKDGVVSDAGIAAELLYAALAASKFTVLINLKYLKDADFKRKAEARMDMVLDGRKELKKQLVKAVKARL